MTRPCLCGLAVRPRRLFGFTAREAVGGAPSFRTVLSDLGGSGLPPTFTPTTLLAGVSKIQGGRSPPPRFLAAEVQTLDLRICQQRGPRPLEAVSPELQRVGAVGDGKRARRVLLDQHQRVPGALYLPELVEDQRDELRREPE